MSRRLNESTVTLRSDLCTSHRLCANSWGTGEGRRIRPSEEKGDFQPDHVSHDLVLNVVNLAACLIKYNSDTAVPYSNLGKRLEIDWKEEIREGTGT